MHDSALTENITFLAVNFEIYLLPMYKQNNVQFYSKRTTVCI